MILADANFLIFMFSDKPEDSERRDKCQAYLEQQRLNKIKIITSTIALSEAIVLMSPEDKANYTKRLVKSGIVILPFGIADAHLVEFDRDPKKDANYNRKKYKVDTMLFASALANQCNKIVTNDNGFNTLNNKAKKPIQIKMIDNMNIKDNSVQLEIEFKP